MNLSIGHTKSLLFFHQKFSRSQANVFPGFESSELDVLVDVFAITHQSSGFESAGFDDKLRGRETSLGLKDNVVARCSCGVDAKLFALKAVRHSITLGVSVLSTDGIAVPLGLVA